MMNTIALLFSPIQWIFIGLVVTLLLLISLYQLIVYSRPVRLRHKASKEEGRDWPSVSVVLYVTNKYKMLRRTLPNLLEQDYPCYEVVVVNDRSEDNSDILLRTLQEQYPHLQVRTTSTDDRFGRSPSIAIGMGIRAAQYDAILCIEADCKIKDNQWIRSMSAPYGGKTEVVLGHTTHYKCPLLKRCDCLQHALAYLGRAAIGRPYTGVGSNVLFKKSLFYDNNGFNVRLTREHSPLRVFIGEVVKRNNCGICVQPSGVTHFHMRMDRHQRKLFRKMERRSLRLNPKAPKYPMLFESSLRLLFYLLTFSAIALFYHRLGLLLFFCSLLFLRLLSVTLLYVRVRKKMEEKGLAIPFLLWDILFPFVNLYRVFG